MSNLEHHSGLYHTAEDQLLCSHSPRFLATPITLQLLLVRWGRDHVHLKWVDSGFDVGLTWRGMKICIAFSNVRVCYSFSSLFPFPVFKSVKFPPNKPWSCLYLEVCGEVRGKKKVFAVSLIFPSIFPLYSVTLLYDMCNTAAGERNIYIKWNKKRHKVGIISNTITWQIKVFQIIISLYLCFKHHFIHVYNF